MYDNYDFSIILLLGIEGHVVLYTNLELGFNRLLLLSIPGDILGHVPIDSSTHYPGLQVLRAKQGGSLYHFMMVKKLFIIHFLCFFYHFYCLIFFKEDYLHIVQFLGFISIHGSNTYMD